MQLKTNIDKAEALERLLNQARAEADELRGKLARYEKIIVSTRLIMGHELKKPATAISGYLDLVSEDLEGKCPLQTMSFIEKAADECRLLNDLNEYFIELLKVGSTSAEVGREPVDVWHLLKEVVAYVKNELDESRDIDVTVEPNASRVEVDANALRVITMNLLENALRYSQVDSPIRVAVEKGQDRRGGSDRPLLKMRVIDNGVGIPKRYVRKVFDPFVRLRGDAGRGSGLGLTLVRSLVELIGGEVSIQSGDGEGTTVYVTLPMNQRESEPDIEL